MANLMVYTTGRIQFIPNERYDNEREYSEQSIIQLLENDFPNAVLCALDVKNNKREIFNIPLRKNMYKYGRTKDEPDEIRNNNGTYRLWLNAESRDGFYQGLKMYFEQLALFDQPTSAPARPNQVNNAATNRTSRNDTTDDYQTNTSKNVRPESVIIQPNDFIRDVHLLSEYIQNGNVDGASKTASQLASRNVRIQSKSSENTRREQEFKIYIQLDGNEFNIDQNGGKIPVNVVPSTTVRELRAAFEGSYGYIPTNQYFFVNGQLAHDSSTMENLNVGPNSLFILFYLSHPKVDRPWKCRSCRTDNPSSNSRCITCSAQATN